MLASWPAAEQIELGVRLNTKREVPTPVLLYSCISHSARINITETKTLNRTERTGDTTLFEGSVTLTYDATLK